MDKVIKFTYVLHKNCNQNIEPRGNLIWSKPKPNATRLKL